MEAKRRALDEIATRQNAADEKRKDDSERREQVSVSGGNRTWIRKTGADPGSSSSITGAVKGLDVDYFENV
jgi:hypothetical protein